DKVATQIRSALIDTFSFARRALGQDVVLSEVISVIQNLPGVVYVDVDLLRGIPEKTVAPDGTRQPSTPEEIIKAVQQPLLDAKGKPLPEPLNRIASQLAGVENGTVRAAQLAIISSDLPDTLILNQIL
ncbi:MAG TPA: hypothetical protein VLN44_09390, partial [Pyrinomonadaceae bacterium]|nr:hypothetical protein [Pyrinomonadaceae bacterium]